MRHHHSPHQPRFGDGFDRAGRWQRDGSQGPEGRDDFGSERRGRSGDPRAHGGRPGGGRGRRGPEGFGPADRGPDGFDPRGFGPDGKGLGGFGTYGPGRRDDPRDGGFGPHGGGRGGGRGRRGGPDRRGRGPHRAPRGDVRTAVLLLLAEEPMHGYQLMQTITERTGSRWRPSPGAIYPTISQLEDEGLVITEKSGGRKLASLTEAGHAHVEENFVHVGGSVPRGRAVSGRRGHRSARARARSARRRAGDRPAPARTSRCARPPSCSKRPAEVSTRSSPAHRPRRARIRRPTIRRDPQGFVGGPVRGVFPSPSRCPYAS